MTGSDRGERLRIRRPGLLSNALIQRIGLGSLSRFEGDWKWLRFEEWEGVDHVKVYIKEDGARRCEESAEPWVIFLPPLKITLR